MNREEKLYVCNVHETVVMTQVLDNNALRKAYNLIYNRPEETLVQPIIAKQAIYSWYEHNAAMFLHTLEELLTEPSHEEEIEFIIHDAPVEDEIKKGIQDEIDVLEYRKKDATSPKQRRSLSMRITNLKKKL